MIEHGSKVKLPDGRKGYVFTHIGQVTARNGDTYVLEPSHGHSEIVVRFGQGRWIPIREFPGLVLVVTTRKPEPVVAYMGDLVEADGDDAR